MYDNILFSICVEVPSLPFLDLDMGAKQDDDMCIAKFFVQQAPKAGVYQCHFSTAPHTKMISMTSR